MKVKKAVSEGFLLDRTPCKHLRVARACIEVRRGDKTRQEPAAGRRWRGAGGTSRPGVCGRTEAGGSTAGGRGEQEPRHGTLHTAEPTARFLAKAVKY